MKHVMRVSLPTLALLLCLIPRAATAQTYQTDRRTSGSISFEINGVPINEESTLEKQSILLNDTGAPVTITRYEGSFGYEDRSYVHEGTVEARAEQPVRAVEMRHVFYDVFGDHLENLSSTIVKDIQTGTFSDNATWRILDDHDVMEHMVTVSYIAHVRLADGTVWSFDRDRLVGALTQLDLEGEIEDEGDDGDGSQ